ncbi:unnamed protein product [Protopolystoma xenopodis]|uniref:Cation channel complex component UNC80 N-terminal domain-containing protein n=1 Tax=Protopolystoma xenopodis TaxID=117903 RepID=A0A3S5A7W0_9PLAT|nr:unnamed protein product [Protopolystoma xenopodis]
MVKLTDDAGEPSGNPWGPCSDDVRHRTDESSAHRGRIAVRQETIRTNPQPQLQGNSPAAFDETNLRIPSTRLFKRNERFSNMNPLRDSSKPSFSTTFERVLVQNLLHGRCQSLCEAIQTIGRWQLIRYAFPHVMHCAAVMLGEKLQSIAMLQRARSLDSESDACDGPRPPLKFDSFETKLLYTLHWILLDAAAECKDSDDAAEAIRRDSALQPL